MTDRTATTTWEGTLKHGKGKARLDSSGIGELDVSWPSRVDSPDGQTSPEELLAAAQASCYSMVLANELLGAGGTPQSLETRATVTLDLSSLSVTKVVLRVRASVQGLDDAAFRKAADAAKGACPVSQLFADSAAITLDAALI